MSKKYKKWSDDELNFLRVAYPSKEFTTDEISEQLNRSKEAVRSKATSLGLKVYKEDIPSGYKKCTKCENILPIEMFTIRSDFKNRYRSWCKVCRNDKNKIYKKSVKIVQTYEPPQTGHHTTGHPQSEPPQTGHITKKCRDCNEVKSIDQFYKNKNNKDNHESYCKKCSSIRKENSVLKRMQEKGW